MYIGKKYWILLIFFTLTETRKSIYNHGLRAQKIKKHIRSLFSAANMSRQSSPTGSKAQTPSVASPTNGTIDEENNWEREEKIWNLWYQTKLTFVVELVFGYGQLDSEKGL